SALPPGPTQQLLQLNLAHPISEGRPLRLLLRAHLRRPANNQPLTSDYFRVATIGSVLDSRRLLAIHITDPRARIELSGDENLKRLDPQQVLPADTKLFEAPPGPLLFEAASIPENLRAVVTATAPHYRADISVQAILGGEDIRQSVSIRCQP